MRNIKKRNKTLGDNFGLSFDDNDLHLFGPIRGVALCSPCAGPMYTVPGYCGHPDAYKTTAGITLQEFRATCVVVRFTNAAGTVDDAKAWCLVDCRPRRIRITRLSVCSVWSKSPGNPASTFVVDVPDGRPLQGTRAHIRLQC
jgi:hypothetical protein